MTYSIDTLLNKKVRLSGDCTVEPLKYLAGVTNLRLMTLESFLELYNPSLDIMNSVFNLSEPYESRPIMKPAKKMKLKESTHMFTLNQLVKHLEMNCTTVCGGNSEVQVRSSYILMKIINHFTEYKDRALSAKKHMFTKPSEEERKYLIYFAVDITSVDYSNPLERIHGFTILDDSPCICKPPDQSYLSIVAICANPYSGLRGIKGTGSYLLMFTILFAYEYNFNKVILEVTNDIADTPDSEEEDSEEEDSEEEDSEEEESGEESGEESDEESGEEDEEEKEEEKTMDPEEAYWAAMKSTDSEDSEDSDDEDDDDELSRCCKEVINQNIHCNMDQPDYDPNDNVDKYDFKDREEFLKTQSFSNLKSLADCYDISKPRSKEEQIKKILFYEFWNMIEYQDMYENVDCGPWKYSKDDDEELWKYGGPKYFEGRDSTSKLYCDFYERHGFKENPALNIIEKCFTRDALPSMEINIPVSLEHKEEELSKLMRVFIERKYYSQRSDYCQSAMGDILPDIKIIS